MKYFGIKETGQKLLAAAVLTGFSYAGYQGILQPVQAAPGQAVEVAYSAADASRMFCDLGGKPGEKPVVVFVTSWCPVCRALEQTLKSMNVPYARGEVEKDQTAALYYQVLTQGRGNGVPLTVVGTKSFIGYDIKGIKSALKELGRGINGNSVV